MWLEHGCKKGVMMDEGVVDGVRVEEIPWAASCFVKPRKGVSSRMHIAGARERMDSEG